MELSNYNKAYTIYNKTGLHFLYGDKKEVIKNIKQILKLLEIGDD